MRSVLYTCLFALFVALATPLCTPDQWEGFQTGITAYVSLEDHERGRLEEYIHLSYDYTNKRSSAFLQRQDNGDWTFYHVINIFNDTVGHTYAINLLTDDCTVTVREPPFRRNCIPEGATFTGNFFLGPEGVFNVSSYRACGPLQTSYLTVSQDGDEVIPVMEKVHGIEDGYTIDQTFTFRGITPGIESENVFDIPGECSDDDAWLKKAKHLTRDHFVLAM